jgi:hypothetical protein
MIGWVPVSKPAAVAIGTDTSAGIYSPGGSRCG